MEHLLRREQKDRKRQREQEKSDKLRRKKERVQDKKAQARQQEKQNWVALTASHNHVKATLAAAAASSSALLASQQSTRDPTADPAELYMKIHSQVMESSAPFMPKDIPAPLCGASSSSSSSSSSSGESRNAAEERINAAASFRSAAGDGSAHLLSAEFALPFVSRASVFQLEIVAGLVPFQMEGCQ